MQTEGNIDKRIKLMNVEKKKIKKMQKKISLFFIIFYVIMNNRFNL